MFQILYKLFNKKIYKNRNAKYKLIKNKDVLWHTNYFEFLPGKFIGNMWNENSVFLDSESVFIFANEFYKVNPNYDPYFSIKFTKEQIKLLIFEIDNIIFKIRNNTYEVDFDTNMLSYLQIKNRKENEIRKYQNEILEMLNELSNWLKETIQNHNEIWIIGL